MHSPSDILSEAGPLAALIPDYAMRPQQLEMAERIADSIHAHTSLVCEAGTGTGKTFAYLIPAILSGLKVLVSTGTRHLQDQLFQRDLKILQQATGVALNAALLKGRANYLCLHRLEIAEEDQGRLNAVVVSDLHAVRQWSRQTRGGDLAELTDLPEEAGVRQFITSTTDNCLGQECRYYHDCFVFRARRRAAEADLTVVNHHLLLADMALREQGYGELLPAVDVVIFDEAHQLPELASRFFSRTLSSYQFADLARDCRQAYFREAADLPAFPDLVDAMETAARRLRLAFGRADHRAAWYAVRGREAVGESLRGLRECCAALHRLLDAFANRGKELDNCYRRCGAMLALLDGFLESGGDDLVQWLETRGSAFLMHQTPLDVAESFQARMAEYDSLCIYTSATLAVNGDFRHFAGQLGLEGVASAAWESPFDSRRQALLYLPPGLPDPRREDYSRSVLEAALPVLALTRGRAFLLFTSHRALQAAAADIRGRLAYPVFIQGEAPKTELLESFRASRDGVLLGTQSFWEGVDVKGQALSCVIIDKLPFAAPDDPVLQARLKKLAEQGGRPFMDYQLPEAVITLKQGVGRLIRDAADYGVLMICDPRLTGKSYGRLFLKSLPEMQATDSLETVAEFLARHESGTGDRGA